MFQNNKKRQKGFTLVELMLSVGFVGSLLVLIALITIQIMGLYNKGLTLKEVNEVSRIVVRDMQQSITGADAFRIQYSNEGVQTVAKSLQDATESGRDADYYSNPAGGRLCTGVYTYVWNTGAALKSRNTLFAGSDDRRTFRGAGGTIDYPIQFIKYADGREEPVRFIKVRDPAKQFCRTPATESGAAPSVADVEKHAQILSVSEGGTERSFLNVFGTGNNNLVLYKFEITDNGVASAGQSSEAYITAASSFYHVGLTLGTQNGDENDEQGFIAATGGDCKPPAVAQMNEGEYCAVNKIDFVARTGRISR